uniref:CUB domain-containing protein n=1 Tax=Sparus aurata TaxID=8175 RepID=A0A671WNI5_SPAAU
MIIVSLCLFCFCLHQLWTCSLIPTLFMYNSRFLCLSVHSPQYPRPYLPNLLMKRDLSVPKGYHIQLSLTHLDIEESSGCSQDSLTVRVLHDQEVLGKFCGQKNSTDYPDRESILSQSNKLSLIFRTSDSTPELQQHIGFSGVYKAIGRVFMITSPFSTILYFL